MRANQTMVCLSQLKRNGKFWCFGFTVLVEIAGTVELQRELPFVEDYYGFGNSWASLICTFFT